MHESRKENLRTKVDEELCSGPPPTEAACVIPDGGRNDTEGERESVKDGIATNGTCAVSNMGACDARNTSSADSIRLLALCATEALAGEWGDGIIEDAAPASSKWRSEGKWLRLKKVSRSLAGDDDTRVAVNVVGVVTEDSDAGSRNMYRRQRWKPFGRSCNVLRRGRIALCKEGISCSDGAPPVGCEGGVKGGNGAYPSKDKLLSDGR